MPLKKSAGNMYTWCTHVHSHLGGECGFACYYCYTRRSRFGIPPRYQGKVRLIEEEFDVKYGSGKTIFIEHMNDLFADGVPDNDIDRVLTHCQQFPDNKYVFQTKNPARAAVWFYGKPDFAKKLKSFVMGTTIETNRDLLGISMAPTPADRARGIMQFKDPFVTIEPILELDVLTLVGWLKEINPCFVNIGADSKHCNLPEPTPAEVKELVAELQKAGIVINKKSNLGRMLE